MPPLIGQTLGQYQIVERLVDTATGVVFHTQMTGNTNIFRDFVKPRLSLGPDASQNLSLTERTEVTDFDSSGTNDDPKPQILLSKAVEVAAGNTAKMPIVVPQAAVFGVTLSAPPQVGSTLFDPGNSVRGSIAANSPEANELFRTFPVENPSIGTWYLELKNEGTEPVTVLLSGWVDGSPVQLGLEIKEPDRSNRVPILATLTQNGAPITGATVKATVTSSNGTSTDHSLFDDGLHGDGQGSDGVYGSLTQSLALGDYGVLVEAKRPSFMRLTTGSIYISNPPQAPEPKNVYLPIVIK